ncbi:hypothetical protein BDW59DRAFT_142434, partial [Aspergillus cavernicola]
LLRFLPAFFDLLLKRLPYLLLNPFQFSLLSCLLILLVFLCLFLLPTLHNL